MTDEEIIAKGFKPWPSGSRSLLGPNDYDGGHVLLRNGTIMNAHQIMHDDLGSPYWRDDCASNDIIGYHPKQTTKPHKITIPDGPAPEWARKRWGQVLNQAGLDIPRAAAHLIAMLEEPPAEDPLYEPLKAVVEMGRYDTREQVALLRDELDRRGLAITPKEQSND